VKPTHHRDASSRVVIIGGGIAGISAAWALSAANANRDPHPRREVVLLESRRVAGGRAGSFADPVSGELTDYCQHVAMGCCTNFIDLLKDAGLADRMTRYPALNFYHPETGISPFRPSRFLPAPLHLNSALAGLPYLSLMQKMRIRLGLWKLMRTKESQLLDTVAANWLSANGQSAEIRKRFWDVILVSALGDVPERVSMAAARKVIIDGFAAARGASDVWVPNEPLSTIFGEHMIDALGQRGVDVRLGTSVRAIEARTAGAGASMLLADGNSIDSQHVILATSWRAASRLIQTIDASELDATTQQWQRRLIQNFESVSASPITGLHLWFDRALTPLPHVAMVGTTAHWLFRQPIDAPDSQTGCYHQVVISGRHDLSDAPKEELAEHVVNELRNAFPGARDAVLLRSRVVTDPAAVYSVSPDWQSRRPACETPLSWLHLAGDYVQTGWPATMEGATISGRTAADRVQHGLAHARGHVPTHVQPGLRPGGIARWLIRG